MMEGLENNVLIKFSLLKTVQVFIAAFTLHCIWHVLSG